MRSYLKHYKIILICFFNYVKIRRHPWFGTSSKTGCLAARIGEFIAYRALNCRLLKRCRSFTLLNTELLHCTRIFIHVHRINYERAAIKCCAQGKALECLISEEPLKINVIHPFTARQYKHKLSVLYNYKYII